MTYRFNQSAISSCIAVTLCYGPYSKVGVGVERIFQNSKGSVRRILPGCDGRAQGTNIDSQTLLQIHVEVSNLARVSVQAEPRVLGNNCGGPGMRVYRHGAQRRTHLFPGPVAQLHHSLDRFLELDRFLQDRHNFLSCPRHLLKP